MRRACGDTAAQPIERPLTLTWSSLMTHAQRLTSVVFVALGLLLPSVASAQTEGDYLYNVTMFRAAPGEFDAFMAVLRESSALVQEAGDDAPFWIRHSQGDQWDFMLIYPMGDHSSYYDAARTRRRASVWESANGRRVSEQLAAVTSYREEWLARSAPLEEMNRRFDGAGLFHIEMFAGLPGQREDLLEQRRMENRYYTHLDRQLNMMFVREGGSNWDAMTIGFYESLQAYAQAGVRYTADEQDEAAKVAGFSGVDAIGPYLRSLLSYHRDTLGVASR